MYHDVPVIVLCGDGGSGKDAIAQLLSFQWKLPFKHSHSWIAARQMWVQIQEGRFNPLTRHEKVIPCPYPSMEHYTMQRSDFRSIEEFYAQRVNHRKFWSDWIDCYNQASESGAGLYINCVQEGNYILTGIRKLKELQAFVQTGIPDLWIWIERHGVPRDITQEYGPERCVLTLRNDDQIENRVRQLGRWMQKMVGYLREKPKVVHD